jgi:outer membrane protein insertion porin family
MDSVKVAVLPFEIHSMDNLSYIQTEIVKVIKSNLQQEGAAVVDVPITSALEKELITGGVYEIQRFGLKVGADYVVWGSLTWIGNKFSLDTKLIESFSNESPTVFFQEGQGAENLLGIVNQLAEEIGMKIFKREKVTGVLVAGNKRIETDAIKKNIKTKPGDIFLAKSLSEDLKAVYSMGYFEDIRIEAEEGPEGKTIIFNVQEKPTIRVIRFKGNKVFDDEKINENINITTGSILNIFRVRSNIQRIEDLYKDKNYHNVNVSYNINQLDHNQADLEFIIEEGEKILIRKIIFEGNSAYKDKELKKIMETSEKGFFSWLTSSGDLNRENLDQDVAKLSAFYNNNGYVQARVGDPKIEFKEDGIEITIKVDEGPQFNVGRVDITGDLVLDKDKLMEKLKITQEVYYNREIVRNDVLVLTDIYSDEGYAYADISPQIDKDTEELKVDITYTIEKGKQVYFETIFISGNTKTRDKVIRRELKVYEQELYSGKRLKQGVNNLYRLEYFEEVKTNTAKGSADDKMILKIDVTEKPTGTFTFGAGYSSVESVFGSASISQRNLFGRGQTLQLTGQVGSRTTRYNLNFTEPWLFDIPLSAGFNIYNWETDYDDYDRHSIGGGVRFGYPVYDFTRVYLHYNYDDADIDNISENAAKSIKDLEGTNITSKVSTTLSYDSRDRLFNPTKGSDHSIKLEYAGLGGNIGFTKYELEIGWIIPLLWTHTGFLHGKAGYVTENPGGKLPDYERYYLGGINSMRGFEWRGIYALDEEGNEIGGDKLVQFNVEYRIPLLPEQGIVGVLFYDMGDVYNNDESIDLGNLKQSAGFGFRWYSPLGPIRIEYGRILDAGEIDETGGRWEFTMGAAF